MRSRLSLGLGICAVTEASSAQPPSVVIPPPMPIFENVSRDFHLRFSGKENDLQRVRALALQSGFEYLNIASPMPGLIVKLPGRSGEAELAFVERLRGQDPSGISFEKVCLPPPF